MRDFTLRACALFLLLAPLLAVPSGAAGPKKGALPTVVLLPVILHGEQPKEALASYQGAIAESLQSRYKVIASSKVEEVLKKAMRKESQEAAECDMTHCYGEISREFNAEFVAVVDVTKTEGDYTVSLKIMNVVANELELSKTDTCRNCKPIDVVEKLKLLAGGEKASAPAVETPAEASQASKGAGGNEMELAYWNSIKDSVNADDFAAYLESYPKGSFAPLAKSRIAALKKTAGQAQETTSKKAADDASGKELAFWNSIKDGVNADDFAAYLQAYPAGTFALLAKSRIASLKKPAPREQAAAPTPAPAPAWATAAPGGGAAGPKKAAVKPAVKPRVVLLVALQGEQPKDVKSSYQAAVAESLQSRYTVIVGSAVEEVQKKVMLKESQKEGCTETRCLGAIATEFNAEFVAIVDVTKMEGDYSVSLKILDVAGELALSKTDTCRSCKVIQVVEKLKLLAGGGLADGGVE